MKILVTGALAGLGLEITNALTAQGHRVVPWDRSIHPGMDVANPDMQILHTLCSGGLDVLINNAGVNETAWLEEMTDELWDRVMNVNAKGIWKMTQACLPYLSMHSGAVLNIVSNAAHVPMRTSLAYNASKAAAHIMTKQMNRELLDRHGVTVFGVAPNKLKGTPMSRDIESRVCKTRGWTPEEAEAYQLASLPARRESDPAVLAEFIAGFFKSQSHYIYHAGQVIPFGG